MASNLLMCRQLYTFNVISRMYVAVIFILINMEYSRCNWRRLAQQYGIGRGEIEGMAPAFDMRYKE